MPGAFLLVAQMRSRASIYCYYSCDRVLNSSTHIKPHELCHMHLYFQLKHTMQELGTRVSIPLLWLLLLVEYGLLLPHTYIYYTTENFQVVN